MALVELKEKNGRLHLPDKIMRPRGLSPLPVMEVLNIHDVGTDSYIGVGGLPSSLLNHSHAMLPEDDRQEDLAVRASPKP